MAHYFDHTADVQPGDIKRLKAELARLHTGEEDGYDPHVHPTPGQWLRKFNQAPAEERLAVVARILDACSRAAACFEQNHDARIRQLEDLLRVAHETSNRSEAERAAAVQRADIAETELRVLRAGLRANGADPTQIQNLWAQIRLRNRQWRDTKRELAEAQASIERVRALHRKASHGTTCVYCAHGQRLGYDTDWPCDTIRALDGTEQPTTEA